MSITHRKVVIPTLNGNKTEVNLPRLLKLRVVVSNTRLWLTKKIVPYGWAVMDEADVSHYEYLKDLFKERKESGND